MCDVTGTTYVMIASMIMTAAAGVYAADSKKKEGQYRAEVAQQNAELDDYRAAQAATIGAVQEDQHRAKVRQMVGSQRASLAANGLDLGSGTAADMVDETQAAGEVDALTIRFNAMNEAWGYRTSAVNERNGGKFAKWAGKREATGAYLSTAASVASQGSSAYGSGTFSKKPATGAA